MLERITLGIICYFYGCVINLIFIYMSTRKYKGSPLQMLLALRIILENAIRIADKIKEVRPKWDEAFLRSCLDRVNAILRNDFDINFTMSLRERADIIGRVEAAARILLQQIQIQIELDFKNDYVTRKSLIETLGFYRTKSLGLASQSQLLSILQLFSRNMTAEIEEQLVDAGMNPKLIADTHQLAAECEMLNVELDSFGRATVQLSYDDISRLVSLYEEVMDIVTITTVLLPEVAETAALSYMQALYEVGYVDPPPRTRSTTTTRRKRRRRY